MKPTRILVINTTEDFGKKLSDALGDVGYELAQASTDLDESINDLISSYPEVGCFVNKTPGENIQHPYLQIIMAAYRYRYLHSQTESSIS